MQVALCKLYSEFIKQNCPKLSQGVFSRGKTLKNAYHDSRIFRMKLNRAISFVIDIAKWCTPWIVPLFGLFVHAFNNLFAQILDVVACEYELHSMNEFHLRAGTFGNDLPFFHEMDFY